MTPPLENPVNRSLSSDLVLQHKKRALGKASLAILCVGAAAALTVGIGLSFIINRPEIQSQNANTEIRNIRLDSESQTSETADQLSDAAMRAYQAGQLFAPAGDNALELYLSALAQDPSDFGAKEAIFELIPPATLALEAAISAANSSEIERLAQILSKADPSSSRTTALIARGQAQIAANEADKISLANAQRATQQLAESIVVTEPESSALTAALVATPSKTNAVTDSALVPAKPLAKVVADAPKTPAPTLASLGNPTVQSSIEKQAIGAIVEARVIKSFPPLFPADAKRRKASGWVDLKLQINTSGRVTDAEVVGSKPGRIFDAEARRAVLRWQFSPKMVGNEAVVSTVNQRITFKPES